MTAPATLVPAVLLGGPLCGAPLKFMASSVEAEVFFGPTREIFVYRALDETDRSGARIFKFTGVQRAADP